MSQSDAPLKLNKPTNGAANVELPNLWMHVPYFADLSDEVIAQLCAHSKPRSYRAGTIIFLEGEPTAGLFIVERGMVKISRFSKDGREYILHMVTRGDTFNDVSVLDGGSNPATATAHTDTKVWSVRRSDLQALVERHPELAWRLIESVARRTRYVLDLVHDLSMRNVRGRLANLLLEQAQRADADIMPQLLTQEEMASRIGTVREVVGRTLRSMAADQIIEFDRHQIVVLDSVRLAEEAAA